MDARVSPASTCSPSKSVSVGAQRLCIEDVVGVAKGRLAVRLADHPDFAGRIRRGAEFLERLLADSGVHIKLPWGAPHEEARAKRLAEGREYVEVLPRMSLEQVAQVLAGARAVVSVDTGLSHLTAALDKPNFTLYGPTDPGLIGGYGKNQHIVRPENSASTGDIAASRIHLLLQNQGLL